MNANGGTYFPSQPQSDSSSNKKQKNWGPSDVSTQVAAEKHMQQQQGDQTCLSTTTITTITSTPGKAAHPEHCNTEMLSTFDPRPPPPQPTIRPAPPSDPFEQVRGRRLKMSQEGSLDSVQASSVIGPSPPPKQRAELGDRPSSLTSIPIADNSQTPNHAEKPANNHHYHTASPLSPFRERCYSLPAAQWTQSSMQEQQQLQQLRHSSRVILSTLQPGRVPPSLQGNMSSVSLRTANQIDRDCLDYKRCDRLHRNLSDSRLLVNTMVTENSSVDSMKSSFSVLNPIRPRDVRNRYCRGVEPLFFCV